MPKFTSLTLSDNDRHAITNGIFNAITHDMPDHIQEENLPTAVGASLFRWNYINRNVSHNLGGHFEICFSPRGPWKVMLLFEQALGFTFSIMSENNFAKLQKKLPEGIHYIEALISQNVRYDVIEGQLQIEGFERKERDSTLIEKLRNELLQFDGIINNHFLILFDYAFNKVLSVRVVLLTPQMEVAFSEDWSTYLEKPYYLQNSDVNAELLDDDDEPLVSLKEPENHPELDGIVALPEVPMISGK